MEIQSKKSLIFNKKICNSFLIVCVNIRSLSNPLNFSKLERFVYNLNPKPDIIAVTETWIHNNSPGPYCYLENYLENKLILSLTAEKLPRLVELVYILKIAINLT